MSPKMLLVAVVTVMMPAGIASAQDLLAADSSDAEVEAASVYDGLTETVTTVATDKARSIVHGATITRLIDHGLLITLPTGATLLVGFRQREGAVRPELAVQRY